MFGALRAFTYDLIPETPCKVNINFDQIVGLKLCVKIFGTKYKVNLWTKLPLNISSEKR